MVGVYKLPSHEECGGCRSVGSSIYPSSQSHKMSIGIVADSAHKARKKAGLVAKSSEPVAYHQTPIPQTSEGFSEKKDRGASLEKENHIPGEERPPWISTKDKPSVSKTLAQENQNLTTHFDAMYKLNGFSRSHSVRPVSEVASNASKRINQAVNNDTVPQVAAEAVPDKIKSINKPSNTLKMKLLEVLGPDTLPDDDKDLCDNQEQTRKANELENYIDVTAGNHAETPFEKNANDSAFKYGLNSDPIESDSDGPNNIMKRPVTRSFKRKSALPKSSPKRADNGLCRSLQKMNKHATVQIRGKKWSKEPKSTSVLSGGKRVAVKGVRIEPHKINFVEENDADKKASTNTKRSAKSLDTTAGLAEKYESSHLGSPLTDKNQTVPKGRFQHKDFRQNSTVKATSPDARPRGEGHLHSLGNDKENIIPQFGTHQRGFGLPDTKKGGNSINKSVNTKENESLREWFGISKKIFKPQEILHPITKATTPVEIPSPQPTEIFDQVRGDHNAVEENIFMGVKISNFGNWRTLNPRRNSSRVLVESSEDTLEKEVKDCPAVNSPASLDKSAPEGCRSDSSEDNSHTGVRSDGLNSDPIEGDSDGPNNIMKRPVTRSFKRKSALPKSSPKRADNGLCRSLQKMNKHATVQIRGKKWSKEPKSTSVLSGGKRVAVKGVRIEPHKINFVEENDADKKASTNTKRSAKSLDTTAGLGEKYESSHLGSPLTDKNQTVPKSRFQHKDFRQNSSVKATSPDARPKGEGHPHSLGNDKENIIPQFGTHQRGFGLPDAKKGGNSINKSVNTKDNESLREWFGISKKIFKPQEILHPITKATTPVEIPSPQPTEIFDQVRGDHNAVEENIFMGVKISNFGDWRTLNPRRNSSRVLVESSEDTLEKEVKDCPAENSPASLDKSASEGYSSDSSEDNSHTGARSDGVSEKQDVSSPEVNSESSESCLHRGKRPRRHEGTKFEYEEDDVFCVPSGQVEDDDLSRAVTMLAVALKKLETKVNSAMRKKSSEIVHSTAEGLNLQLQNVKTLIQRDIEKVTRIGKSKRKRMETMFQEQQEQLKIFHDNYKKGLNQHIQDTINMIEEMETDQAELKGSLEKQKSQHKKVLLQVEEEMEKRLNEAHKLISNLHKVSNEKLLQLKYVIADCLK